VDTILMVGTRKGLWVGRSDDRRDWSWSGPHFDMSEVYSTLVDTRAGRTRLWAGPSSSWLGPQVQFSDDLGESWTEAGAVAFPDDVDASVERVWQLTPGIEPGLLYAGTEPGAVFASRDDGMSWVLERGLWDHPHRPEWGAGFGGQAFHTVLPHPTEADKVLAAISSGGCYRTDDGGATWSAYNSGIRAEFLPEGEQYPEFGQCTHKVARHPSRPERLFLQNHGGVYRSDDEGGRWQEIHDGLPVNFGFPIVVHPHQPDTVFVFPLEASHARYPAGGRARVYRSPDAGESWEELGHGLPDDYFVGVMRDAMCADDHEVTGLYFGDRGGSVWVSPDEGESWLEAARHLPDVMSVRAAAVV
jgi:hypothetical protein